MATVNYSKQYMRPQALHDAYHNSTNSPSFMWVSIEGNWDDYANSVLR